LGAAPEAHPANLEAMEILETRGPCRRMLQCSVIWSCLMDAWRSSSSAEHGRALLRVRPW